MRFAYNNIYQSAIKMALYEDIGGGDIDWSIKKRKKKKRRHRLVCWDGCFWVKNLGP